MIARFSGAVLGLFAFGVAASVGLLVGNPPMTVVSRALWALVIFCFLGMVVGWAAQAVINEFTARREEALRATDEGESHGANEAETGASVSAKATAVE